MPSLPSNWDARRHAMWLLLDETATPRSSRLDASLTVLSERAILPAKATHLSVLPQDSDASVRMALSKEAAEGLRGEVTS